MWAVGAVRAPQPWERLLSPVPASDKDVARPARQAGSLIALVKAVWEKHPRVDVSRVWKQAVVAVVPPPQRVPRVVGWSVASPPVEQARGADVT